MIRGEGACLVCGKPLTYFETARTMECVFCHKESESYVSCEDGHYVCDECHAAKGVEAIMEYCLDCRSKNPIEILQAIMDTPYIYIHGPEHHIMVGAALLTAYKNAGGDIDLPSALQEMKSRGSKYPGGSCGFWGCCGAAVSTETTALCISRKICGMTVLTGSDHTEGSERMRIYDISQEVFGCEVYPGDEIPSKWEDLRISRGDLYNLTSFSMCAHNGTHIDAPFHFLEDGDTAEQIPLEKLVGDCYVSQQNEDIDGKKARQILTCAKGIGRILIKGTGIVTLAAAQVFAEAGIDLIGVESQSVGPVDAPMAVHKVLLGARVVLLEGIRLGEVAEGEYFLNAAPISLAGSDGAPCRAILIDM